MQNKPNLQVSQMNVSYVKTKNYEQKTVDDNKAKQTQLVVSIAEPFMVSLSNQQSQFLYQK